MEKILIILDSFEYKRKELELKKFEDQQKDIKKQEESIERLKAFGREKHLKRARSKEKALAKKQYSVTLFLPLQV